MQNQEISEIIIGAAFKIHRELGNGILLYFGAPSVQIKRLFNNYP